MDNPLGHQDETGHPDDQTGDVNERITLVSFYVPQGYLQIVIKHDQPPTNRVRNKEGKCFEHLTPIPYSGFGITIGCAEIMEDFFIITDERFVVFFISD
jgi:hypothetical protein